MGDKPRLIVAPGLAVSESKLEFVCLKANGEVDIYLEGRTGPIVLGDKNGKALLERLGAELPAGHGNQIGHQ